MEVPKEESWGEKEQTARLTQREVNESMNNLFVNETKFSINCFFTCNQSKRQTEYP